MENYSDVLRDDSPACRCPPKHPAVMLMITMTDGILMVLVIASVKRPYKWINHLVMR